MGARISSEKAAIAEAKELTELEKKEGTEFPGSDYRSDNHKEWMSTLELGRIKVRDVLWPGTHDSATDKIGIYGVSRPFAQCQSLSIYKQLCQGVRVFDIRVESTGRVCHGILKSYKADTVIASLKKFLSETKSEVVILEVRTEFGYDDPPEYDKWLVDQIGADNLVTHDANVFDKTLEEILPKRVICIWKPRKTAAPSPGSLLFSSAFLKDNWTDTDLPLAKFNANMKHLGEHPANKDRKYFYRVENTCTPQVTSAILCVYPVTNRIRPRARLFISQAYKKGLGDHLQILSQDFVDDDDLIDACIGVTKSRQSS
ncbi:hypothetical protein SELMODRAFT_233224 [Selaginella moellendorffii]|nr:uncharacterized protein LOC9659269 [Selaginella moellendorffii]XP_024517931.1 uncharacterized protein LOC9638029 [Selaginella moellendorffii]EFJ19969.1 hypothetical protein SELMODRAFT_233224 [Selaginella moellendorffii]|eukprot:XP_002979012.1 uncharacterized protein LOC9659269 [Selaginella moellendorffii]